MAVLNREKTLGKGSPVLRLGSSGEDLVTGGGLRNDGRTGDQLWYANRHLSGPFVLGLIPNI